MKQETKKITKVLRKKELQRTRDMYIHTHARRYGSFHRAACKQSLNEIMHVYTYAYICTAPLAVIDVTTDEKHRRTEASKR